MSEQQLWYERGDASEDESPDEPPSALLEIRRALGELAEAVEDLAEASCEDTYTLDTIRQRLARVRSFALLG